MASQLVHRFDKAIFIMGKGGKKQTPLLGIPELFSFV
jgi:hypothetical protein